MGRPASTSWSMEVLCSPTWAAPSIRCSMLTLIRTPRASAIWPASAIMAAARSLVTSARHISLNVAPVRALIGLKARLPQALTHRWDRMSVSTRDLKPASPKAAASAAARSDRAPSISPTGNRSPSMWAMTPGLVLTAAG